MIDWISTHRKLVIIVVAIGLIIGVAGLVLWQQFRIITVHTDTTPVTLELNRKTYQVTSKTKRIIVRPNVYPYRATATTNGQPISLISTIDTSGHKNTLNLNYGMYTTQAIIDVLCSTDTHTPCLFNSRTIKVTYLENYQWAVVAINSPVVGKGSAVLQANNGKWDVVGGPGTDTISDGDWPQSVREALTNAE